MARDHSKVPELGQWCDALGADAVMGVDRALCGMAVGSAVTAIPPWLWRRRSGRVLSRAPDGGEDDRFGETGRREEWLPSAA